MQNISQSILEQASMRSYKKINHEEHEGKRRKKSEEKRRKKIKVKESVIDENGRKLASTTCRCNHLTAFVILQTVQMEKG